MKTIMIIGAGKTQLPLIEAAKREAYYTVICDIDQNAQGVSLADEFFKISTKDRYGLFEAAKKRGHIDGVIANSEYAMEDVAFITHRLGVVGNPESAIKSLSSKGEFRKLQKKAGIFAPKYITDASLVKLKESTLTFPVIIKPDKSSATRGTTIIEDPSKEDEIKKAILKCNQLSQNEKVIVEEYIHFPTNATIEGEVFVHNGKILWDGLFLTLRSKYSPMIPMTYIFPLPLKKEQVVLLKDAIEYVFHYAGVFHGEYNIEAVFPNHNEPFIIEINPRQGGNDLPRYVQDHCGIDYYRLLVTTSVGDDYYWSSLKNFKRANHNIVHHVLYPKENGYFKGVRISEMLERYIYRSNIDVNIGDIIKETRDGASGIGYVDLVFKNVEEQLRVSNRLEQLIRIEVEAI